MKIVQKCDEAVKKHEKPAELSVGTVFKLQGFTTVYLRVATGFVSLDSNVYIQLSDWANLYNVDYTYPNARVVLE